MSWRFAHPVLASGLFEGHGTVGTVLGAGGTEEDPIPATKKGEGLAVPPAKLLRRRHCQLPDGCHHIGQLPVGTEAIAGER